MKARLWGYRKFQSWVVEKWVLPRWMSDERLDDEKHHGVDSVLSFPEPLKERAWFHAASVGELESLTPVILEWVQQGEECVVTVLSESAHGSIEQLRKTLSEMPGKSIFLGYSPWEGRWLGALQKLKPSVFLTAKYEAWPELWIALAELEIPLLIVSAKARRSLKIAETLCRGLGGQIPRLTLLTVREEDSEELRRLFRSEKVAVMVAGEPRWDRVHARAVEGSPRAKALVERSSRLPRPWGVLGSVWPEDMEVWRGRFAKGSGTLWVVPHRVDGQSVDAVESYLIGAGLRVGRASKKDWLERVDCVLVDEMGVLLELYSEADWAYVGGGFGISMHSTIEPAIFGIPVGCGPNGAEKFPEISELQGTRQLKLIHDSDELDAWLDLKVSDSQHAAWQQQAAARLGATQSILEIMRNRVSLKKRKPIP